MCRNCSSAGSSPCGEANGARGSVETGWTLPTKGSRTEAFIVHRDGTLTKERFLVDGLNQPLHLSEQQQRLWMARLLRRAQTLGHQGEVPVSAVVLDAEGRTIGFGGNQRERDQDPLGHAELVAIRQATRVRGDWRLNDCTLLVTLEPCPMCAGALVQARVGHLIYAARDPKRGAMGSTLDLSNHISAHHHMQVTGGVMGSEASAMLASWFKQRRQRSC